MHNKLGLLFNSQLVDLQQQEVASINYRSLIKQEKIYLLLQEVTIEHKVGLKLAARDQVQMSHP